MRGSIVAAEIAWGIELQNRHLLLAGMSLLLAIHALIVSRFLPSSLFLVVSFCWLWVGVASLFDRLAAVRTMATTMTVILLTIALFMKTTSFGRGDMKAFYFLAMLPSLVAWMCFYVYACHLQKAGDVSGRVLGAWFKDQESERLGGADASRAAGLAFTEEMVGVDFQDNGGDPALFSRIRQPKQNTAG